jgi:phytoene dehydrogenase-like protein
VSKHFTKQVQVVGSGPNGLAAAITLARAGQHVTVLEGADTPGGGMRTQELTLPGFLHDVCAAVTPLAVTSPFFSSLDLQKYGLTWIHAPIALAHPFEGSESTCLYRELDRTAAELGADRAAYLRTYEYLVGTWPELLPALLAPLHFPRHPVPLVRFGIEAIWSAVGLAGMRFRGERARALFAGLAAHSMLPLEKSMSAAFALVLGALAHVVGWPIVAGGTQRLAETLVDELTRLGGKLRTGKWVRNLTLDESKSTFLLDVSPRGMLDLVGDRLPARYRASLERYRYGPGVFKIDWALDAPVPWSDPKCALAGTLHLGGTMAEIARSEAQVWNGEHPERPFVIFVQPSLFDHRRAPAGKHTAWAYCHVPHASTQSMTARIEAQVERFAPGFTHRILARSTMNSIQMETHNPNYVGGDINVGMQDLRGHFLRPVPQRDPYRTPLEGVFLCSSATPPGGGVHGMCGVHSAHSALRWIGEGR